MNKYAIYTDGLTYPVLEKDGQYYIGVPGTGHFSGQWKFLGVRERLKNSRTIIKPEDALKIIDWKFKNGSPRYQVVDLDHGSVRTWAGTSADQQLRSFDTISDSGFNIATKTDKDEEIVLEESKKYAIYATYGGDGVYNSKLVDTVDSEEQAVDKVAELQATGVGASYEEVETKNEECSQASGVASGVNGKIDSFPINPKEMEKRRLKESILVEGKHLNISDFSNINFCVAGTSDMVYNDDVYDVVFVSTEKEAKEQVKKFQQQGIKYSAYKDITNIKNIILNIYDKFKNNNLNYEIDFTVFIRDSEGQVIIGMINYALDFEDATNKLNSASLCLYDYTSADYNNYQGHIEYFGFTSKDKLKKLGPKNIDSVKDAEEEMINYIRQWLGTDYTEEDDDNDILFDTLNNLIDYLNDNTNYEWDANEIYDNCAITESEDLGSYDYIEVFCWLDSKTQKVHYTINSKGNDTGTQYNSLEDVIKNLPILDRDIEDDLNESKNDKNLHWIYDENEKLYHCEIDNWYFNIYELEDGTYNLIVDYDEEELQDLDDIFDTLEEAKKKAQEIYNKGISEYNDNDFAGFEYETESKDLTKTLQEMALLEDYEEDKTISPQKQKFIDYCKDKIEDLGDVEIYDEDYEEDIQYHKLMHTEGIREFNDLYIIANFEEYDENLKAINSENKMVIDTPMIDCNGYAATMQFDKIDQEYYHTLLEYWNDLYMDEIIEEE